MTDDNPRITALTTDAIRSIGEKMVEEIGERSKRWMIWPMASARWPRNTRKRLAPARWS